MQDPVNSHLTGDVMSKIEEMKDLMHLLVQSLQNGAPAYSLEANMQQILRECL
jgi:hypothetical protein